MIQEQTLSKILQEKDSSVITLNNLTAEYFSEYQAEFDFIKNHLTNYSIIPDVETFLNVFPDFPLLEVHEPTSYLLEELVRDKNKRFLAENYSKVRQLILDNKVEDALTILKQASEESSSLISLQSVDIVKDTSRYDNYLQRMENFDEFFIKTGFSELDALIGGWDARDELATIVARNGLGKSWLLLKFAAAAALQGKNVGIYSGEMSEDKVGYRIDSIIGHLPNGALIHGGASIKNEYQRFLENMSSTISGSIKVITPKLINGPATVSALRAFVEKEHLDVLFIDQYSLLEDERKAKNPVEKLSNISRDLKLLQVMKRIPIISVCQQNREKLDGNQKFDTTQVAGSDFIAQNSTLILFIERDNDLMRLHIVKSRDNGSGQSLAYKINLNVGEWNYVPEGEQKTSEYSVVDSNNVPYSPSDMDVFS